MWIMMKDAFFSVVDKECASDELLVRARRPGDIERYFPAVAVRESFGTDYRYRACVKRFEITRVLAEQIDDYSASNFKSSVRDRKLHDAYVSVWHVMEKLQPGGAYAKEHAKMI